jgi:heterodisulfide reductase subunit C
MKFITRKDLEAWLQAKSTDRDLFAPVEEDGVLLYKDVEQLEDIVWDYFRPVKSFKEILFPQTEHLLLIEEKGGNIELTQKFSSKPTLIFGVRPCDARGALVLDRLLVETKPEDPYYKARRKNTALVGIACEAMGETCFCTSVGVEPTDSNGMDVMLHAIKGGYLVEIVTEKGEKLFDGFSLADTDEEIPGVDHQAEFSVPPQEIWKTSFESRVWMDESERCLSCRICAYVCPTCRCFDVRDEHLPSKNGADYSERVRCWDSCSGEAYRRIAGGHNPREAKADRLRNRMYCKLHYIMEQSGMMACTGCGRCIDSCPVNIDITEIMGLITEGIQI